MKKIVLMFVLAALGFASYAQDFDKVRNDVLLKKTEEAKKELDKIMADPKVKNKTDGYYWTFALYSIFYADSSLSAKYPGSDSLALQALHDYEQKDTSLKALKDNNSITHDIDNLRSMGFNNGAKSFNSHNYEMAYKGFSVAVKMDDFINAHNLYAKRFIDTNTILYAGYAAQNSGRLPEAVGFYKKLADDKIKIESKDFQNNLYAYLLDYYLRNNDMADFNKYLPVVKTMYPQFNSQWDQMEMQYTTTNTSLLDLVKKYKQDAAGGSLTESKYVTYAEAMAQPDKDEFAKLDSLQQLQVKLAAAEAFSKAYALAVTANAGGDNVQEVNLSKSGTDTKAAPTNNSGIYAYNAGVIYYNVYEDLDQRFYNLRGEGAGLKAKRDETEKLQTPYSDSVIIWLTNCYNILKVKTDMDRREKNLIKNAVQDLANVYQWKEDKAKGVNPKDVDKYDALYKQFDAETDKYSK